MAAGIIHSLTFTPKAAGRLVVTCVYDTQVTTGDNWGSNVESRVFCTQSGSSVFSNNFYAGTARERHMAQWVFDVIGGASVQCGLFGNVMGASASTWWTVNISATLLKK